MEPNMITMHDDVRGDPVLAALDILEKATKCDVLEIAGDGLWLIFEPRSVGDMSVHGEGGVFRVEGILADVHLPGRRAQIDFGSRAPDDCERRLGRELRKGQTDQLTRNAMRT